MGTNRAGTTFNFSNGRVEIGLFTGAGLNSLAHELKHAYQFETGEYSVGPALRGEEFSNFLYDKYDEVSAYNRESLFGGRSTYNANNLPSEYADVATGPVNATTHPNIGPNVLNSPMNVQKKYFQGIADRTGQAFRINGVTYYTPR